ncbi:MAG: methyltransferase domain-containing protein [Alphaproteobacteria bacterium]|nr:methyltransferase domain-containing protein [Alphaproteobacteria bacterium]
MDRIATESGVLERSLGFRLKVAVIGLAQDFWKEPKKAKAFVPRSAPPSEDDIRAMIMQDDENALSSEAPDAYMLRRRPVPWHADPVEVAEQIWGEGALLPGGEAYLDALSSPLGISSDMSVLDLAAGLGDMARYLAEHYRVYVTGLERDEATATRGMVMSIAVGKAKMAPVEAYDPADFKVRRRYDCVFARELFYRIENKDSFFQAIHAGVKENGGQIVFTDYIVEDNVRQAPAIKAWFEQEGTIFPDPMITMIKRWRALGYDMRIAEDQTELYKSFIVKGLVDFTNFMVMNIPDAPTRLAVAAELERWAIRMAAFAQGLRYCRFYGIKR